MVNLKCGDRSYPEFKLFQEVEQFFTVNQLDRRCSVTRGLFLCLCRKAARGHDNALVGAPVHGAAEVTNVHGRNRVAVPFALKQHLERNKRIDLQDAVPVNASIPALAGDLNIGEARLAQ